MTRKKPDPADKRAKKEKWEDDGRTIASMNVEGMPWYAPEGKTAGERGRPSGERKEPVLTPRESRYYTWGALKAALAVIGVMCAGLVLFILFCQFVWFK